MGCREGLEAAAPSTVKESPRRPCSGWWERSAGLTVAGTGSVHCRRETAVSPNMRLAGGEWTGCKGGKTNASPNCQPEWKWGWMDLHTKPRRVAVTDLSEESAFGAGRNAFGLASPRNGETTLLIPTRRSGTTRVSRSGRLVGPLHVNPLAWLLAGRRPATGSPNRSGGRARGLGSAARGLPLCSLDTEEEGVEKSLALLGMNCWEQPTEFWLSGTSTTALTASPKTQIVRWVRPLKTLFLLPNLGQVEPQMAFCGHRSRHRAPHGTCGVLGGSQSQVSGSS